MFHVPACLDPAVHRIAATTWCGIEFFWAKVRSGKSHHIVKTRIVPGLREGRHIYTNMDFGGPMKVGGKVVLSEEKKAGLLYTAYLGKDVRHLIHCITPEWIRKNLTLGEEQNEFENIPHGSRVIIDEVQKIFPVTGYKSNPDGFFRLLTMCGHYDIDFCFISQNHTLVDKRIISTSSDVVMIKNAGFMSSLMKNFYHVAHFQSIYDRKPYSTEKLKFDPDIFKLYKSADSIVKGKTRIIPSFLYFPLGAVAVWFMIMAYRVPKSGWVHGEFYEKDKGKGLRQAAPVAAPQVPGQAPAAVPVSLRDVPVDRPLTGVEQFYAKYAAAVSTEPAAGSPGLVDLLEEEKKNTVFYNGLTAPKRGYWRKEKDGSFTAVQSH